MDKKTKEGWERRLREADGETLVSALMGCSMELSLCDEELEPDPGEHFASKEQLLEEEAMLLAEVKRRVANGDPDVLDAKDKKAQQWAQMLEIVKSRQ